MTIQEQLDALRYQVEEPTVDCPCGCHRYIGEAGSLAHNYVECVQCRGISRIPNPRLAPLREALRVPCPCLFGCPNDCYKCCGIYPQPKGHKANCVSCYGTGYVPRDVSDWPEGAVKGLVLSGAYASALKAPDPLSWGVLLTATTLSYCFKAASDALDALREVRP